MTIKEIIINIGDLKEGDLVLGTDNEWHEVDILPIHMPESMYELKFSNGTVKCSGTHMWTFFDSLNSPITLTTDDIYNNDLAGEDFNYGKKNSGPNLIDIKRIEPILSRCVALKNSDDHLFEVFTELDIENNNIGEFEIEIERNIK